MDHHRNGPMFVGRPWFEAAPIVPIGGGPLLSEQLPTDLSSSVPATESAVQPVDEQQTIEASSSSGVRPITTAMDPAAASDSPSTMLVIIPALNLPAGSSWSAVAVGSESGGDQAVDETLAPSSASTPLVAASVAGALTLAAAVALMTV